MRQRLAHVVHRERGDRGAGQRFHLDAGLVRDRDFTANCQFGRGDEFHGKVAALDGQRMAKWNQIVGTLCSHGAGDDRCIHNRAFLAVHTIGAQLVRHSEWKTYGRDCHRLTPSYGFGANIDHAWVTASVDVAYFGKFLCHITHQW